MEKTIQLALADDHKIYRDGIRISLQHYTNLKIVWEAEDGRDMLQKLAMQQPDILLLDISMPEIDGIKALQIIRKEYDRVKVIILSMFDDKETIANMMEFGANAYLVKTTDAEEIYHAIVTCFNEDFYFNDLVNSAVLLKLQNKTSLRSSDEVAKFNKKELQILKLISEDKTTEEISEKIFLSPRTVETTRQNMKTKAGVKTIAGLLMYGIRNKLIDY